MNLYQSLAALLIPVALGCGGGSGIPVQGKLVRNNAEFAIPEGQKYLLQLTGSTGSYIAEADNDGTFSPRNERGCPEPGIYEAQMTIYTEGTEGTTSVNLTYEDPITLSGGEPNLTLDIDKFR